MPHTNLGFTYPGAILVGVAVGRSAGGKDVWGETLAGRADCVWQQDQDGTSHLWKHVEAAPRCAAMRSSRCSDGGQIAPLR